MPIKKTDRFYNDFRTESVNFLLGNRSNKIRIERDIEVQNYAISTSASPIIANYTDGVIGGQWLYDPQGQFKYFEIGDVLEHKNYNTNVVGPPATPTPGQVTILDKIDDTLIQLDGDVTGGAGVDIALGASIFNNTTPVSALRYKFNQIENLEAINFISKVDGSEQIMNVADIAHDAYATSGTLTTGKKYIISDYNGGDDFTNVGAASNTTGTVFTATGSTPTTWSNGSTVNECFDLAFVGSACYQTGEAFIYGTGLNTTGVYGFKFTLVHYTKIYPFFLWDELTDLEADIQPAYFLGGKCLKDVCELEFDIDFNNPNRKVKEQFDELEGNTGGYDENFNGGNTNYYIDSITYEDTTPATVEGAIYSSTEETTVTVVVKNVIDNPFSDGNTKFSVTFVHLPQNEDEYQANGKTLNENFLYDYALNTVGSAAVDGDNIGTGYQILKTVAATFVAIDQIEITFKIAADQDVIDYLNTLDQKKYMILVSVQDHTLATIDSDLVTLKADVNEWYENETDEGMIVIDNVFLRHFESNPLTEGTTDFEAYKEDELVAYSAFYIDSTGRTLDQFGNDQKIQLVSVEAKIKAKNIVTLEEFDLDTTGVLPMTGYPIINDNTFVQLTTARPFHVPSTEKRKNIEVYRRPSLDTGNQSYYTVQFPFIVRWENFIQDLSVDHDFFQLSQQNNGLNKNWYRIATHNADWKVFYEITVKARKYSVDGNGDIISTGSNLTYTEEYQATLYDYEEKAPDYQAHSIKSYTYPGGVELYDSGSGDRYILGYDYTKIEASFENTSTSISAGDVEIRCWIEEHENATSGGRDGSRRISTIWPLTADTWFKSIDGSGVSDKVVNQVTPLLNVANDTITTNFLVDFSLLPPGLGDLKICARLYDTLSGMPLARVTEDGFDRLSEDGYIREVEA